MLTEQQSQGETLSPFKRWYQRNSKKLNAQRRKRYHKDEAYRKKQLVASRSWREKHPEYKGVPKEAEGPPHYSISHVAEKLNTCPQTIRSIEKRGLIPPTKKGAEHRKYTEPQIESMRPLIEYLQGHNYRSIGYIKHVQKLSKMIKAAWNQP